MVKVIIKLKARPDKEDEIIAMNNAVKLVCKVLPEPWTAVEPHGLQGEITQENLDLIRATPAITEVMNIEEIPVSSTTA